MKQVLTLMALFLFVTLFGQTNKTFKQELKLFEKDNYSIQYPNIWKIESPGPFMEPFCLFGPKEKDYVYVNLINAEDSKKWQGKFKEYIENEWNELSVMSEVIKKEQIDDSTYKFQFKTVIDDEVFKSIRYFYLLDDNIYLLTFCAKDKIYNLYLKQGESIISTFKIKSK